MDSTPGSLPMVPHFRDFGRSLARKPSQSDISVI